jgi:hypothetical protein
MPCIYYGTEQAFSGPEASERKWLPDFFGGSNDQLKQDRYLRETMFGADHPLASGQLGITGQKDAGLPGFGAFGSVGAHFFDKSFEVYVRISELARVRSAFPVLRFGRQYQREISNFSSPFQYPDAGELITWSRLLDEEECLCVVTGSDTDERGGDVIVDSSINNSPTSFFEVIANTTQTIFGQAYRGTHPKGERLPVFFRNGAAYISIRNLAPCEVLILTNIP